MEKVFYKGQPYEFTVRKNNRHRVFTLYKDNAVFTEVVEHDLDIKSLVTLILEDYYNEITQREMNPAL